MSDQLETGVGSGNGEAADRNFDGSDIFDPTPEVNPAPLNTPANPVLPNTSQTPLPDVTETPLFPPAAAVKAKTAPVPELHPHLKVLDDIIWLIGHENTVDGVLDIHSRKAVNSLKEARHFLHLGLK